MRQARGFTLIEVMIVVAVLAILAAIAFPSYTQYVNRGKIAEATSGLSELRLRAEKYFADNRTYQVVPASGTTAGFSSAITQAKYFSFACVAATANEFTCTATGTGLAGASFTINQSNARGSTFNATQMPGWNNSTTCWITKKGETC
ncbi:MAG TPA: type IV pilin protein [Burkholderiales bacterium]|jgi:type IV pilus assembly protein PilE